MITRAITGSLFVIAIIAGVYFNETVAFGLFALITLLGVDEFYGLVKKSKEIKPIRVWGTFSALTLLIVLGLIPHSSMAPKWVLLPACMLFFTFFIELFRKKEFPFVNIAYTLLGVFYVVLPFAMLFHLGYYKGSYNYQLILGFFFLLWTSDTGAYLSGKFLGKHKLFERISPKKTWEGSIGGLILSLVVAYVLSIYFTDLKLANWLIIAGLVVIFGGMGDLVESMLKRSLHIKDSGNILPGHGGILDRFDGLLLSVPFVYAYLWLIR
ncbi:MAG: phosphatidate cytidylyltransferase [Flavobacteriales bacterium]|nr:phosphatidate cytidylyltransferase [Flavobacteriales bacterium]